MRRAALAKALIDAPDRRARSALLARFRHLADEKLAAELRKACYAAWTVEPVRAQRAAAAARLLAARSSEPIINATAAWLRGISEITKGKFEAAVSSLDGAAAILKDKNDAAQVQVARLLALAMLSRYDEAMTAGRQALKVFVATGDHLAAGKIEMNLSNIAARQGRYREAEKYGMSALRRFITTGEKMWQAMAENSLANTYTDLNEFNKAEKFYRRALETALGQNMLVTEAEVEASLGNLASLRGRYADALRYLESSRQRYEDLAMPHQSAIAELEIADIYLELNMLGVAVEIYRRVAPVFHRLKMRAEEARTRLEHGRVAAKLGEPRTAKRELGTALKLFRAEGNLNAQASVLLSQAELALSVGHPDDALATLRGAGRLIEQTKNARQRTSLDLFQGKAFGAMGKNARAEQKLRSAADTARKHEQPAALQSALDALGRLAALDGDARNAKRYFARSIDVVERLRSPLGANEFGIAFFASRLGPYESLARLQLDEGKVTDAFATIERGRSRSLLDAMGARDNRHRVPPKLRTRAAELRAELNSHYKALERPAEDTERVRSQIENTEAALAKADRQIASLSLQTANVKGERSMFDIRKVRQALKDSTLIEYVKLDGSFSAFVVTKNSNVYVRGLGTKDEIAALLEELHFQFGTLRYGGAMSRFATQLKGRADAVLARLYDKLVRPLENELGTEKLVIVPVGPLHYVPFAALRGGGRYFAERFEITLAPSAAVWRELQRRKSGKFRSSLLMAYADERIPLAEDEARKLSRIVPDPALLTGRRATFNAFNAISGRHDLVHLACHGQFRQDDPMLSSLHLADGWITVQDLTKQRLRAGLVTLSACETGLSKVFAGDELLGLARGFLAAGAVSLVVSLWTVNDEAALRLMERFYISLQRGASPAASLMDAQKELIGFGAHPYFWAPFVCIGR